MGLSRAANEYEHRQIWVAHCGTDRHDGVEEKGVSHMRPINKVRACLFLNVVLLCSVMACIVSFADDESSCFRWGPSDDFV